MLGKNIKDSIWYSLCDNMRISVCNNTWNGVWHRVHNIAWYRTFNARDRVEESIYESLLRSKNNVR